jgi:hypothetical protein
MRVALEFCLNVNSIQQSVITQCVSVKRKIKKWRFYVKFSVQYFIGYDNKQFDYQEFPGFAKIALFGGPLTVLQFATLVAVQTITSANRKPNCVWNLTVQT